MIIGLQIVAILFAFSMLYFAVLHYRRGEINGIEVYSWIFIWTFTILIVIFPEILKTVANTFLVSRVFDLMVVGAFILVISMVTSSYIRTKRIERKLEEFVRKEAYRNKK